jgi:hypothetical protein
LPQKPTMPQRLEVHDILGATTGGGGGGGVGGDKFSYLESSLKQSLSISSDVVSSAREAGQSHLH